MVGSLTILSYLATAVVSALSGAMYVSTLSAVPWPTWMVVALAAVPIVGFAALNLIGLKESTKLVFGVAAFHFAMLIVMDVYGLFLAFTQGAHWERLTTGFGALTPHAFLTDIRVRIARRKLQAGEQPAEIALECGFADQAHFTRHFKARTGVTPAVFRNG